MGRMQSGRLELSSIIPVTSTGAIPVTSVFNRTGDVGSQVGDYVASEITNDSSISGATVKDALDSTTILYSSTGHIHDDRYYTETESDLKYSPVVHTHDDRYYTESESDLRYSSTGHIHDDRYYTESESSILFSSTGHIHSASQITTNTTSFNNILTTSETDVQLALDRIDDYAEPVIGAKGTAFNKNFETSTGNIKMDDAVSVGVLTTIPRSDHAHPHDIKQSAGIWTEPSISVPTSSGNIIIGTGTYLLYSTSEYDESNLKQYTLSGGTFAIPNDGAQHYIVANYNSGSPVVQRISDVTLINQSDVIPIVTVYNLLGSVCYLFWDTMAKGLSNKLCHRLVKTERFAVESGGLILGEKATRYITISGGNVWYGACYDTKDAVDSSVAGDEIALWYHSGGVWTRTEITQYNNSQYDDGTNLQSLGSGRYAVNWVFRGLFNPHSHPVVVLGTEDYKQGEAVASSLPSDLPLSIQNFAILVGRIIVENGSSSAYQIDSAFEKHLPLSGITDHNGLSNLQGGTTDEYYHLTATEHTTATQTASASQNGLLSSVDWSLFNSKQDAMTSSTGVVYAEAGAPAKTIYVTSSGITKIGSNLGGLNYAQIDADGTIVLNGTATTFEDLRIDAGLARPGSVAPTDETGFRGNVNFYARNFFNNQADEIQFQVQMPHGWKIGSGVYPHVHFSPWTTTGTGNFAVQFILEYYIANFDSQFPTPPSTHTMTYTWSNTDKQWYHCIASNGTAMSMTGKSISTVLKCRLYRDNTVANNYAERVTLLYFDIHYEVDMLGSRQQYIK